MAAVDALIDSGKLGISPRRTSTCAASRWNDVGSSGTGGVPLDATRPCKRLCSRWRAFAVILRLDPDTIANQSSSRVRRAVCQNVLLRNEKNDIRCGGGKIVLLLGVQ